jgi:hypothetical protein
MLQIAVPLVMIAACAGKPAAQSPPPASDCDTVAAKLARLHHAMAKGDDKLEHQMQLETDRNVQECRPDPAKFFASEAYFRCVLAAKDDDGVKACADAP